MSDALQPRALTPATPPRIAPLAAQGVSAPDRPRRPPPPPSPSIPMPALAAALDAATSAAPPAVPAPPAPVPAAPAPAAPAPAALAPAAPAPAVPAPAVPAPAVPAPAVPAPAVPAPAASAPPAPPAASVPPAPPAASVPPAPQPGDAPSAHVLRLANDVRALRLALGYVQRKLMEALKDGAGEDAARRAAQAAQAELGTARGAIDRLVDENERLKQALDGARRTSDQWTEQARRAEAQLRAMVQATTENAARFDALTRTLAAANDRIASLTEFAVGHQAAADQLRRTTVEQRAELETTRAERDATVQRCRELEAELERAGLRWPRSDGPAFPPRAIDVAQPPPLMVVTADDGRPL